MPFVPPDDNETPEDPESGKAPPGGLVGLGGTLGNLSRAELIAELANRGQRIIDEDQAAVELARQRRRGQTNGTANFTPSRITSRATSDTVDVRPNRFQRGNPPGRLR